MMKLRILGIVCCLVIAAGCTYKPNGRLNKPSTCTVSYPDTALAGGSTGKIAGTVLDAYGKGIFGANVLLVETQQGVSVQNMDGSFVILAVPVGEYTLQVTSLGFARLVVPNLKVYGGLTTTLNAKMGEEVLTGGEYTVSFVR